MQRLARFPHLRVISEPDRGLYDAINKGILVARGDVICLVNSDDLLLPLALSRVVAAFTENSQADAVCGKVQVGSLSDIGETIEIGTIPMLRLRAQDIISGVPLTNGRFFRRAVFDRVGMFDQRFPILGDRDFLARFYLAGSTTAPIAAAVYRYIRHDSSLTFGSDYAPTAQLHEAIRLASLRLAEVDAPDRRRFYQHWISWAKGYAAMRALFELDISGAGAALTAGASGGILSPLLFIAEAVRHAREISARRGEILKR